MSDERLQVLKMLEEGKINAEEASELLEALGETAPSTKATTSAAPAAKAKWLRIEVEEKDGNHVNVKLPLFIIRAALRFGGKFNIAGFSSADLGPEVMASLEKALIAGEEGHLIDVTADDGDHVHLYLE